MRMRFQLRHHPAWSSSRTIWLITFPSAFPLYRGSTWAITLPMSLAPPAIASRTAARISAGSAAGGRNSSSTLIWDDSTPASSGREAWVYCSTASCRILMPLRSTSTTSASEAGRRSSISRFLRLARIVPRTRVRSLSCALRAALSAVRKVAVRLDSGDTRTPPGLADGRTQFALPLFTRLFEVTVLAKVRQDAGLLTFFLETSERPLEALVIMDDDFWHSRTHPSRPGKGGDRNRLGIYSGPRYGARRSGVTLVARSS